MKSMTFAEFFAMPPGTIFGQATGLPHQLSTGLYRKGESHPDDGEDGHCIAAFEILLNEHGDDMVKWYFSPGELEEEHEFLVYGPGDVARLVGVLGDGTATPCHHCGRPIEGQTAGLAFCGKPCVVACAMTLPLGEPPVSEMPVRGIVGVRPGTFGEAMRRAAHEGGEGGR